MSYKLGGSFLLHATALAVLILGGCSSPTELTLSSPCPQGGEFGNYGCARLVLVLEEPPLPWPRIRWDFRVLPTEELTERIGGPAFTYIHSKSYRPEKVLNVIWHWPAREENVDTASAWVVMKLLEDPRPAETGVPLEVFAEDSEFRLLKFWPAGTIPEPDTVRLDLRNGA